jgi:SAM-dependent methyltransferase
MKAKPGHLGEVYGRQFCDESVAGAYYARPAYPEELFDVLEGLMDRRPWRVLELGCGSGDLTIELGRRVDHLDGVDFSAAMLDKARARPGAERGNIHWHLIAAESFEAEISYNLVVAGESLHWMDWEWLFPKIDAFLAEDGLLVIANRAVVGQPWAEEVRRIIPRYSTNLEYEAYDLIAELDERGLFCEIGRMTTAAVPFEQSLDDYVESFHSSNGLSRERMEPAAAEAFDESVRRIAGPYVAGGRVKGQVVGRLVWGRVGKTINNQQDNNS